MEGVGVQNVKLYKEGLIMDPVTVNPYPLNRHDLGIHKNEYNICICPTSNTFPELEGNRPLQGLSSALSLVLGII